jgi:DNA-binding CsgD family transcriptional regulator
LLAVANNRLAALATCIPDYPRTSALLGTAFDLLSDGGPSRLLVDTLNLQAVPHLHAGRYAEVFSTLQQARAMARAIGYESGEAFACVFLSLAAGEAGESGAALEWAREACRIDRARVDGKTARMQFLALTNALEANGDFETAEAVLVDGLDYARQVDDFGTETRTLVRLAGVMMHTARWHDAAAHLAAALSLGWEVADKGELYPCLYLVAAWTARHDAERAAVLFGAADVLAERIGVQPVAAWAPLVAEARRQITTSLGKSGARQAVQVGRAMTLDRVVELANASLMASSIVSRAGEVAEVTRRERDLLVLLAEGLTDKEIGEKLFISVRTVRSHLDRIREKTGCRRRADLTRLALEHHLTNPHISRSP